MAENSQAVLLGKGVDKDGNVLEVKGERFYRGAQTGVADSIRAVLGAGLFRVPTYMQGEGRIAAVQDAQARGNVQLALQDPIWGHFGDSYAERLTILDEKGILGQKRQLYVVSLQNAALFSNDHQRIRNAVVNRELVDYALQLTQPEVDTFLEALRDANPTATFKQHDWVKNEGSPVYVFKGQNGFNEFNDASSKDGFLADMPAYVVVEKAEEARTVPSGRYAVSQQRGNKNLVVDFGGKKQLGKLMDAAEALGYTQFGSYHDGFTIENGGRLVVLDDHDGGLNGSDYLGSNGGSLGVAPEALVARQKIVGSVPQINLEKTVAQEAQQRMVPENNVRRLLTEDIGYNASKVDELMRRLSAYASK
ncbi:hypothetical protein HYY69_06570 [Candidatus Woesearchaeota archaeon]|nr:hypothetical protein [Candidatus Woesearchaeota archaeon]